MADGAKSIFLLCLTALLLAACAQSQPIAHTEQAPAVLPSPTAEAPDLTPLFGDIDGTFVLYDAPGDTILIHNEDRADTRFSPFSTFKILSSLIGLETEVIEDADFVIPWDSEKYPLDGLPPVEPFTEWAHDHSLRSAIRYSVVWYYRELALRVGEEKMRHYVEAADYGNADISGGLDQFWLDSSLQISAREQVDFLTRFYRGELPFSERSVTIVKDTILLEETDGYRLSGKTGSGPFDDGIALGWFIGYVERGGDVYIFALNIEGEDYAAVSEARVSLTKAILRELGILPPGE